MGSRANVVPRPHFELIVEYSKIKEDSTNFQRRDLNFQTSKIQAVQLK